MALSSVSLSGICGAPPSASPTDPRDRLAAHLKSLNGAAVAFSGGTDSTLLLALAKEALGSRLLAITLDTGTLPAFERQRAANLGRRLGVRHIIANIDMFRESAFRLNGPDRCYLCKKTLFSKMIEMARCEGFFHILDGTNFDDCAGDRPGMRALSELGIESPLRKLGIGKAAVRAMAREMGLPNWNAPARACLATRIPTGTAVTNERVRRIEKLEEALLALGFSDVRAREDASGKCVRIEVPKDEIDMASASAMRSLIADSGIRAGYASISLDLLGLHSGKRQNG